MYFMSCISIVALLHHMIGIYGLIGMAFLIDVKDKRVNNMNTQLTLVFWKYMDVIC